MTTTVRQRWASAAEALPDKACTGCGATFYTRVGLAQHATLGCFSDQRPSQAVVVRRRRKPYVLTPGGRAALQAGARKTAAKVIRMRRRCAECDLESHPAGISSHQRASGHTGWTAVSS